MVRESDVEVLDYREYLIETGRAAIQGVLQRFLGGPWFDKVPESTAASSFANIERLVAARFEQSMRSLEPAKLTNLYVQRETYPFHLVVTSATEHVMKTFLLAYGDAYKEQVLALSEDVQRRQIEEALVGQVFAWLCPIWPFC